MYPCYRSRSCVYCSTGYFTGYDSNQFCAGAANVIFRHASPVSSLQGRGLGMGERQGELFSLGERSMRVQYASYASTVQFPSR